jgi:DNA-binding response OmpR family regulator
VLLTGDVPPSLLIIEDDEDAGESLQLLLEARGYSAVWAKDAESGVRAAMEHRPDIILLDLGLPDADGVTVGTELKKLGFPVVIALTGRDGAREREKIRTAGFARHLVKPVDIDRIVDVLRGLGSD